MKKKRALFLWLGLILIYGVLADLLLVRFVIYKMYSGRIPNFANLPSTLLVLASLGGLFLCLFMLGLVKNSLLGVYIPFGRLLFSAGLRGVLSMIVALEMFYALTSAYLTFFSVGEPRPVGLSQHLGAFLLWFIEIQTYGTVPILIVTPLSFLVGVLVGISVSRLARASFVIV